MRTAMPRMSRMAAATVLGAVVVLSACKKGENATTDTASMSTTSMTGDTTTMTHTTVSTTGVSDAQIVARVLAANAGEVAAGKVAETKATNADVKAFARMMVTDHQKMWNDLDALAKKLSITPDTAAASAITMANKTTGDMLTAAAKGTTFDTAYVNSQVSGHQSTLDMVKEATGQAQNPELKQALTDAQPKVQSHLDRIKDIQGKMK